MTPNAPNSRNEAGGDSIRRSLGRKLRNRIEVALFALVLCLPGLGYLAGMNDDEHLAENRRLNDRPAWPASAQDWADYPFAFERHFDDHFGFRSYLVQRDKRLEWLGARSDVEIQVGRDEWLFQGREDQLAERSCIGLQPKALGEWLAFHRARRDALQPSGIHYQWILAPNKHTVHPEQLPASVQDELADCAPSQLAESFAQAGIDFLDLRPRLRANAGSGPLYHQTDTHWNQLGAAYGVREIVTQLRQRFPEMPPFRVETFRLRTEPPDFEGNLAERLRVYGEEYREPFRRLERLTEGKAVIGPDEAPLDLRRHSREDPIVSFATGDPALPTALVFHDSFGFAAMTMLAEHFSSVKFINHNGRLDHEMIESEQPDLVLSLMVEMSLLEAPLVDRPLPNREQLAKEEASRPTQLGAHTQ